MPFRGRSWFTSGEQKTLALVAGLFLLGLVVRWWRLSC